MKSYSVYFIILFIIFTSCNRELKITEAKNADSTLSKFFFNFEEEREPVLLILKNDNCDLCKRYLDYIDQNKDYLKNKLPRGTQIYIVPVNNFDSENMWLYHILQTYAFPITIFLNRDQKIKEIFRGAELYQFSSFLNNLGGQTSQNGLKVDTDNINAFNLYLEGYRYILNNKGISEELFNEIVNLNAKDRTFIGVLIEGYYYKQRNIYPERVRIIYDFLNKTIEAGNGFFDTQKKFVYHLMQ